MSISKSAFSLSKDEYEGTGKRLFIGLVIGTAILLCVLLLLIWLVPTIGFAAIHPWLPFIVGIVFGGAILGILWLSVGLVLHAYTGKPILGTSRLRGITIRLLLPIMELMGRMMRIPVAAVRRSFIKVNNELVLSSGIQCEPRQLLVLLPHCIQSAAPTALPTTSTTAPAAGPARSRTYSTCGTPTACRSPSPPGEPSPAASSCRPAPSSS